MSLKSALVAAAIWFSIVQVHAASGLYAGGGVGESKVRENTSAGGFDGSDTAWKAFVGYRTNIIPIIDLAAEAAYVDFGKPSQTVNGQNVDFKLHGPSVAGLVIFPLGPLDFYGKGGVMSWKAETNVGGMNTSRTGTDGFYGAGVGFYVWKIGIRAEYERYQIKDTDRVQLFSINALFQF